MTRIGTLLQTVTVFEQGCNGLPDNMPLDVTDFLPSNMSYFTYR